MNDQFDPLKIKKCKCVMIKKGGGETGNEEIKLTVFRISFDLLTIPILMIFRKSPISTLSTKYPNFANFLCKKCDKSLRLTDE